MYPLPVPSNETATAYVVDGSGPNGVSILLEPKLAISPSQSHNIRILFGDPYSTMRKPNLELFILVIDSRYTYHLFDNSLRGP